MTPFSSQASHVQISLKSGLATSTVLGCMRLALCSALGLSALAAASAAQALPAGGGVVAGSAQLSVSPGAMTVNQTSQNAIINWQGFGIAQGEAVQFVQPNSASVALNRVTGPDPSSILGSLSSNGSVFLVNPNGILFAPGAQVNVGGLVASTLAIADADFMAGRYHFAGGGTGSVINAGSISAAGGYVALLGATISNQGIISARLGTVALAAGQAITLDVVGDGLLNVAIDQGAVNALIENGGLLQADGGQVVMTAQSAGQLLHTVVNNTGVIEARTLHSRNGSISLLGDADSGLVSLGGRLDVSGQGAGDTGGQVTATAHHVGLFGAEITASGDAGGGRVRIGGGYQGLDTTLDNASATYMSADSAIQADGRTTGGGGTVILWGDDSTRAYGLISARGVSHGGLVETSGHALDVVGVRVLAGASNGPDGAWLLDPANVTIGVGTLNGSFVNGVFAPNSGESSATVDAGALQAALNGGADVTITTTNVGAPGNALGDITVAAALTWTTSQTLTLNADHDVIVNAGSAITASTQNAGIVFNAGNDILINAPMTASGQNARIVLTAGANVTANAALTATALNAFIDIGAGGNIGVGAVTADGGGLVTSVTLRADNDVTLNGALSAAGGAVLLRADSDGSGPGALAGTVKFAGPGAVAASTTTTIRFNPNGYTNTAIEIAGYDAKVTGVLDARAWVFPVGVDRPYDGSADATLQFRNIAPADNPNVGNTVTLVGGAATFDTKDVGVLKAVSYTGYTLGGADVARFALFSDFGAPVGDGVTTGAITPIPLTITADDHAAKVYGDVVTFAGTEFTSIGLVNAEAVGNVTLTSAGAAAGATAGVYAITPSSALANGAFAPANYVITYIDGQLPVSAAPAPPASPTPVSPTPPVPPTPTSPTPTSPSPTSPGSVSSGGSPTSTAGGVTPTGLIWPGGAGERRADVSGGTATGDASGGTATGDDTDGTIAGDDAAEGVSLADASSSRPWLAVIGEGVRMPAPEAAATQLSEGPAGQAPGTAPGTAPGAGVGAEDEDEKSELAAPRVYAPKQDRH